MAGQRILKVFAAESHRVGTSAINHGVTFSVRLVAPRHAGQGVDRRPVSLGHLAGAWSM
jgi:hypothetical protein